MRSLKGSCVGLLLAVLVAIPVDRASADTIYEPGSTVLILTMGALVVSGVNLVSIAFTDGSAAIGIAGVAVGTALGVASMLDDSIDGDEGAVVGIGVGAAIIGIFNIVGARNRHKDTELLGMSIEPSVRSFDNQQWVGLQFGRDW